VFELERGLGCIDTIRVGVFVLILENSVLVWAAGKMRRGGRGVDCDGVKTSWVVVARDYSNRVVWRTR